MFYRDESFFKDSRIPFGGSAAAGAYVAGSSFKRIFDFVLAALILFALWPLIFAIAIITFVRSGRDIFEREAVIGKDGLEIELLSFQVNRIGFFGRWVQASGMTELPKLWSVLRGDLSLVGPKPLKLEDFGKFRRNAGLYMKARPGLTGLWRVGEERNLGGIAQARLDSVYIKTGTFLTDINVLLRSPMILLRIA